MGVSSRLENALPTSVHTQHSCYFRTEFPSESESEVAQLCLSLHNPLDCSLPGSSIHGIFKARVLEWGTIAEPQKHCLEGKLSTNQIYEN